jgi:hypothetical protein
MGIRVRERTTHSQTQTIQTLNTDTVRMEGVDGKEGGLETAIGLTVSLNIPIMETEYSQKETNFLKC